MTLAQPPLAGGAVAHAAASSSGSTGSNATPATATAGPMAATHRITAV
jgi:hypothetical protein